jgi:hypothetical protein
MRRLTIVCCLPRVLGVPTWQLRGCAVQHQLEHTVPGLLNVVPLGVLY